MFLSLVVKAVRADVSAPRCAAFAKRLLQVAAGAPPPFACGCLMLASELLKVRPLSSQPASQAGRQAAPPLLGCFLWPPV
jgi:hypothetical protein